MPVSPPADAHAGKLTKCSGKLSGVFAEKDLILLDPSKTK